MDPSHWAYALKMKLQILYVELFRGLRDTLGNIARVFLLTCLLVVSVIVLETLPDCRPTPQQPWLPGP